MRGMFSVVVVLFVMFAVPALASAQALDATAIYVTAFDTMKSLAQPTYIAFNTNVASTGMGFTLGSDNNHQTVFGIGVGSGKS